MESQFKQYPINEIFNEFFAQAGGFKKKLEPGEIADVVNKFNCYLQALEGASKYQITYDFRTMRYAPEIIKRNIPVTMAANVTEYTFGDYQVLEKSVLTEFCLPQANSFTLGPKGQTVLQFADLCKGFLTLNNDRQQTIVDEVPLLYFIRDTAYWRTKGEFQQSRIDWTTSKITFPTSTVPDANVGKIILPVVSYIDQKRYPYLNSIPSGTD